MCVCVCLFSSVLFDGLLNVMKWRLFCSISLSACVCVDFEFVRFFFSFYSSVSTSYFYWCLRVNVCVRLDLCGFLLLFVIPLSLFISFRLYGFHCNAIDALFDRYWPIILSLFYFHNLIYFIAPLPFSFGLFRSPSLICSSNFLTHWRLSTVAIITQDQIDGIKHNNDLIRRSMLHYNFHCILCTASCFETFHWRSRPNCSLVVVPVHNYKFWHTKTIVINCRAQIHSNLAHAHTHTLIALFCMCWFLSGYRSANFMFI